MNSLFKGRKKIIKKKKTKILCKDFIYFFFSQMSSAFFCLFTGYPPRAVTGILGWDGKWSPHMPLKMPLNVLVLLCDFSGLTPYPEHHLFKLIQHQDKQSKNCWPMIPKFSKGKRLLDETDCSSAFPFLFPFL